MQKGGRWYKGRRSSAKPLCRERADITGSDLALPVMASNVSLQARFLPAAVSPETVPVVNALIRQL